MRDKGEAAAVEYIVKTERRKAGLDKEKFLEKVV